MNAAITQQLGRLGYGAAALGNLYRELTDAQTQAVVDAAWSGGVRYFDTAPHYGLGLSERRLGAALATRPRSEYLISTKVGRLLRPSPDRTGHRDEAGFLVPATHERVWDPSPAGIRRSLADSRKRLGLDRIDVAYLHDPEEYDLEAGLTTALPALAELRDRGDLAAIGVGSKSVSALRAAVRTGLCDLIMVAGRITLLDRSGVDELISLCEAHDVGIVAVGVFNSGALAAGGSDADLRYEYEPITADRLAQLRRLHAVCDRFGVRLPDAAVQYPGRLPAVVNTTVGAESPDQIVASVAGLAVDLPEALWSELEAAR